jgi:hypothetical protein
MKRRGRRPAPTDQAAVTARDAVEKYLKTSGLNVAQLSRDSGCSAPAIWRLRGLKVPVWSPTLVKLSEFLKAKNARGPLGDDIAGRLTQAARSAKDPTAATAALLRMVADLLESGVD